MDCKKAINDTLNELKGSFRPADNTDIVKTVQERAEKMKKHENVRQMKFTEITPEYIEPKKSHKALKVAAGIAGTAAVLTGAVFGLNWLNEHGGLKEGGIGSSNGAGYHEDMIEPAQSEAAVTERPEDEEPENNEIVLTCAPSAIDERYFEETDISFDMGDIQAHFIGYSYDGLMLTAKYELTYPEEVTDYPSKFPTFIDMRETTGEIPFFKEPRYSRFISIDGNKVVIERHILNRFADDRFDVLFINTDTAPGGEDLIAAKEAAASGNYTVTVHKTFPDSPVIIRDLSEEMPEYTLPDGTVIYPGKLYVSAYGVFIDFEHIDLPAWNVLCPNMQPFPITLIMADGSEISVANEGQMGGHTDGNSTDFIGGLFDETIDTRNVVSVNILGEPFVTFERETYDNCFQSFYIPPEEDRKALTDAHAETEKCDIKVNWLAFDGMTLVLQYDVTFKDGLPEDGYIPCIAVYGDNNIEPHTTHGSRVDKLEANGNTVSYIGSVIYNSLMCSNDTAEPLTLRFRDASWNADSDYEEYISFLDENAGMLVVKPEMPDTPICEYEINREAAFNWGKTFNIKSVTLCRDSVMFTIDWNGFGAFELHDTYLIMNDGSRIDLDALENKGGTLVENAVVYYHFMLSESIDPSAVKKIYVCGECVYGDTEPIPIMQQEELSEETIADDTETEITE